MSKIWFLKINSSYEFLVKYEVNEQQAYIFYEAAEAPQPLVIIMWRI